MRAYRKNIDVSIEEILKQENVLEAICVKVNGWLTAEQLNYRYGISDTTNRKIIGFINKLLVC